MRSPADSQMTTMGFALEICCCFCFCIYLMTINILYNQCIETASGIRKGMKLKASQECM